MPQADRASRIEAALIGAYVADAAALGFHWLYDPERIAALAGSDPAFRAPDAADFEGFKGVFVHPGKRAGDLSQYGAQLRVAIQSMLATGGTFEIADYQDRFAEAFGPGGSWVGYIDKATKGTLANLSADKREPSGADDDQVPAIARLPAAMAQRGISDRLVDEIIAITSANATAATWGPATAVMLRAAYDGSSPREAALGVAAGMSGVGDALRLAVDESDDETGTIQDKTVAFAGRVGRACPLPQSLPVMFYICARASSYREAIECNILAGGDNCGRAPVLGAVFGAAFGLGGHGVPLEWIGKLRDIEPLTAEIAALVQQTV